MLYISLYNITYFSDYFLVFLILFLLINNISEHKEMKSIIKKEKFINLNSPFIILLKLFKNLKYENRANKKALNKYSVLSFTFYYYFEVKNL